VVADEAGNKTAYTAKSQTTNKATLAGTVTVTGNAVFGQTLTAVTAGLTSTPSVTLGTLSYQWKRGGIDIEDETAATYTLAQADIAQTITVTVTAANCTGSVTSPATAAVTKATQTAPAAPTLASKTHNSITLAAITGAEYRINGGAWQTATLFGGLQPETQYSFEARLAETATHLASPASAATQITTDVEFIPVTDIANIPSAATAGEPLELNGTVIPGNATNQTIVWSITDAGATGATLSGSTLNTVSAGVVVVKATIVNGASVSTDYTKEFSITVNAAFVPVTDITGIPSAATAGEPLELNGTVIPGNATNQTIVWNISNAGSTGAMLEGNVLNTISEGFVILLATVENGVGEGADYTQNFVIEVKETNNIEELFYSSIKVYPNPTSGELKIDVSAGSTTGEPGISNLSIYDAAGRLLKTHRSAFLRQNNSAVTIDLSPLPTGIYLLRIEKDGMVKTVRIVKN
jgi:hypothetical protein